MLHENALSLLMGFEQRVALHEQGSTRTPSSSTTTSDSGGNLSDSDAGSESGRGNGASPFALMASMLRHVDLGSLQFRTFPSSAGLSYSPMQSLYGTY